VKPARITLVAVLVVLTLGGATAGEAAAAERIVAGPAPDTFATRNPRMAVGERLTFLNLDLRAVHNVVSIKRNRRRRPLFSTPTIGFGEEVAVRRARRLGPGSYPFYCSIHPFMRGTLRVG
jgi:plastocyanin